MGLTEDIAAGRCGPFYLVLSAEEYLRVDAVRRWLAALSRSTPPLVHRFRAPRWNLAEIEHALTAIPMFGETVAVVLQDIEKAFSAHQERLVSLLGLRSAQVSVLATAESIDKRTKLYKALAGLGPIEEFARIYEEQRSGWVHRIAGDLGYAVSGEAAATIAELVGEDLMAYEAELKKIILFISATRRIEKDDVDRALFADNRYGEFAIADAVGKQDLARALRVIRQIHLGAGSKTAWMPLLGSTIFRFLILKSLADGRTDQELSAELALNPYLVKRLRPQVARFSREDLLRGIDLLYEAEKDVKSSVLPGLLAAEVFLVRFLRP